MLIGILSDTHDRLPAARAAVAVLRGAGCVYLVHCGDVGSGEILDALAGLPAAFVFGNTDWDRESLRRHAETIGIRCLGAAGTLALAGKTLAVAHGDDARHRTAIVAAQQHDYLLQGHTHVPADSRVGRTRLINPGALHRAARKTVATLDLATDTLRLLSVDVESG